MNIFKKLAKDPEPEEFLDDDLFRRDDLELD